MSNSDQKNNSITPLEFYPVTMERWADFEILFGERGACGGCWCMWWRIKRSEFESRKGENNKKAMKSIIKSGEIPGILGYKENVPIAWCSVAPRDCYPVLNRSRILKKIDETPVWSVVCFYIEKKFRHSGIMIQLLHSAIRYVQEQGGVVLEGYPIEPKKDKFPDVFAWTGIASAFRKVGFIECARRSETRPIMRYYINP